MLRMESFKAMQPRHIQRPNPHLGDPRKLFDVPLSIQTQVLQRDKNCCLFTGTIPRESTEVTWMVPPYFAWLAFPDSSPRETAGMSSKDLENSSNATLMHKDLIPYFNDNAFGVDIDDDYHIVVFREMGSARRLLPTHMPLREHDASFEMFLRGHFHSSLRANIVHGDIRDEYSTDDILTLMGELGVGQEDDDELAPMDDPRWQTMLGKEIWEEVLRQRISDADDRYDSDTEEYNEDAE
ncbi:hypothetical protein BDZ97DRAFT_1838186 [Flammula alnicola]|nr:hypothetical protein BDZ97DRAFT_1838186 [Flammula alnicola]